MTERIAGNEYIRASEFARRLGVSKDTVYYWIKKGYLKAIRFGKEGNMFVRADEIDKMMDELPNSDSVQQSQSLKE